MEQCARTTVVPQNRVVVDSILLHIFIKMANLLDKVKLAGKSVVDAGAKTMLKVRLTHSFVGIAYH